MVVCEDREDAYELARGARMMGVDHLLLVRDVEVDQAVVNLLVGD